MLEIIKIKKNIRIMYFKCWMSMIYIGGVRV